MADEALARTIKNLARQMGFGAAGIAAAGPVPHAEAFGVWLDRDCLAGMDYMRRNLPERLCPSKLMPGARSVICLAASYAPPTQADRAVRQAHRPEPRRGDGLVARYARGEDYHRLLRRRCLALMAAIRQIEPTFVSRVFVDSAPVMERSLAASAGVGWIGRNGCLFVEGAGSYCVLAEIFCNLPLPPDGPASNRCGDCRACLAACPTGALCEDGLVDARQCVSYLTIEHRGAIDPQFWPRMGVRLFGCDACQEVCPHNRDLPAGDPELTGSGPPLGGADLAEVLAWGEADWRQATAGSATRRATHDMLLRNAILAAGNSGDGQLVSRLRALQSSDPRQGELVRWALARLGQPAMGNKSFDAQVG
jgi:epoxyqueuosine reductase